MSAGRVELERNGQGRAAAACAAFLALAAGTAWAQDHPADCHALADPAVRLQCYDRITARPAEAGTPAAEVTSRKPPAGELPPPAAAPAPDSGIPMAKGILAELWGFDRAAGPDRLEIKQHYANYLVARYTNDRNLAPYSPTLGLATGVYADDSVEAKFQLSAKLRVLESRDNGVGLWLAYTQQSFWQVFDAANSRPFRETNYAPEVILAVRPEVFGLIEPEVGTFAWRLLDVGLVHQSNGRSGSASRSWNRAYVQAGFERDKVWGGDLALLARASYRLKENVEDDDNPDITDYYGWGELRAIFRRENLWFSLMARGNTSTGKGAAQFEMGFPLLPDRPNFPLKGFLQVFSGYGESLIDYNWRKTTVGVGLMLNDRR